MPTARFIEPRIEVELAFVLGQTVKGPGLLGVSTCCRPPTTWCRPWKSSTRASCVSIRRRNPPARSWTPSPTNAADAGIVLGGRPIKPMDKDLRWVSALLYRKRVRSKNQAWPRPCSIIRPKAWPWLANKLALFGVTLEPGLVILGRLFHAADLYPCRRCDPCRLR